MVKSSLLAFTAVVVIMFLYAASVDAAVEDVEIFRDIVKGANSFVGSLLSRVGNIGSNIKIGVELDSANEGYADERPVISEIEVDIYERLGLSEAEIEFYGQEKKERFVLTSVDSGEILEMLAEKLDISVREVANLTEFDVENENEQSKEAFRKVERASSEIEKAKWKIGREMERGRNILIASKVLNEAIEVFGGIQDALASRDFKAASQLAQRAKALASKARDVRNFKMIDKKLDKKVDKKNGALKSGDQDDEQKDYIEKSNVGDGLDGSRNFN